MEIIQAVFLGLLAILGLSLIVYVSTEFSKAYHDFDEFDDGLTKEERERYRDYL